MQKLNLYWLKFIKFAEFSGIIISLVLLPIDRFPYIHHVPLSLGFVSLLLLLTATAGRLIGVVREKRYNHLKRYLIIGLILALPVVAYAQSISYAMDREYALGATKLLFAVALRAFCFFVLVSERPQLWSLIRKTIYTTTAVVVVFAFFQFFADIFGASTRITDLRGCCTSNNSTYIFPRVHSTSIEPLYFANYLLIPIWLLTFDMLRNKRLLRSRYHLVLLWACATIVFLIVARGAILALVIAGAIFILGLRRITQVRDFAVRMFKVWALALVSAIILIALAGLASIVVPKIAIHGAKSGIGGNVQIFSSHAVNVVDDSAKTRYVLWPKSLEYIKERPLQGVGAYNSRLRLNLDKYNKGVNPTKLQPFNNDLIGLLVDLGIIGVIAFLPLLVACSAAIYRLFKSSWRFEMAPMALVLIGMLVQSNFFHSILLTRLWIVVGLLLAFFSPRKTPRGEV